MFIPNRSKEPLVKVPKPEKYELLCYHCGTACATDTVCIGDKFFCCDGCKLVYEILNQNGLCDYYNFQTHPGLTQIKPVRNDKYAYLDNPEIADKLYKFTDGIRSVVTFYIPGVHCSSCMWLLEHLHQLNLGITESRLNFTAKEVTIHFNNTTISLRKVVELLITIGYEPYISLDDAAEKTAKGFNKPRIYKLGIAGFCFGNIMMMSFPEYFGNSLGIEKQYAGLFRALNLILALPVFFYCASEFFITAWKGLRQKLINIDAPIALAIIITFGRSVYEIATQSGSGYLDSMSGIVFFMLVGRIVQERSYQSISFNRDYKSYFPIAVNVITPIGVISQSIDTLKVKDVVLLNNEDIIPADALLIKGAAAIDYSFVTGESEPVLVQEGKIIYAGGRHTGEQITIQILKPVAGSYLTSLWNHAAFSKNKVEEQQRISHIHVWSKYFTWVLLSLALLTAGYWWVNDSSRLMQSVTAMLIVACPCALLLSATFTNANLLRIFGNNGIFLRDASVIEQIAKINHIVFDKTGTLTSGNDTLIATGQMLNEQEKSMLYSVVRSSKHPYSRILAKQLCAAPTVETDYWVEIPGEGIHAGIGEHKIFVGNPVLTGDRELQQMGNVCVKIDNQTTVFQLQPAVREQIPQLISDLKKQYQLSLLSGDNNSRQAAMAELFGENSTLLFGQKPADKLCFIEKLQQQQQKVMMIGDGLNDAGALQQSNVGVTLADDVNNFTPACDAILDAKKIEKLPALLRLAKKSNTLISLSFGFSLLYNVIGLSLAMSGQMKPVWAAILMPCSTITIVFIAWGISSLIAYTMGLSLKHTPNIPS